MARKRRSYGRKSKPTPVRFKFLRILIRTLFWLLVIVLVFIALFRWIDPPTTSALIQENFHQERWRDRDLIGFQWRDWDQIDPSMPLAIIAAEDQRFPRHHGIDFTELKRAWQERHRRVRGASTITQQVAKNMFLWSGRTYFRKALEATIAVYIEIVWGKKRILEIYLNIVQFGPNVYGVENAAQTYFGKPSNQLNRLESARLAVVLPNPNTRSAIHASEYVVSRQRFILGQMNQLGGLSVIENL